MVEIIYFPKLCPVCKQPLTVVKKMSGAWWYECYRCQDEDTQPNGLAVDSYDGPCGGQC